MNPLASLWVMPSAPKWRGTSALNGSSTSPRASPLQAGDTMGTGAGHDPTGSARCSKSHCVVKLLPPQEPFKLYLSRSLECEFLISLPSAQKLSMPFPFFPAPSFPVLPFHCLSEVTHSLLFQLLPLPPSCQHFPATQAVHTLNTDSFVKQSSNYLTCL